METLPAIVDHEGHKAVVTNIQVDTAGPGPWRCRFQTAADPATYELDTGGDTGLFGAMANLLVHAQLHACPLIFYTMTKEPRTADTFALAESDLPPAKAPKCPQKHVLSVELHGSGGASSELVFRVGADDYDAVPYRAGPDHQRLTDAVVAAFFSRSVVESIEFTTKPRETAFAKAITVNTAS